jgi:hypothetical protein
VRASCNVIRGNAEVLRESLKRDDEMGLLTTPTPEIRVKQRLLMFLNAMLSAFEEEFNTYMPFLK